jgi:hypothetical protein
MVAGTEDHGYMYTNQWEMPYFNLGSTYSHAEMGYLIAPRPFMVERGHHDAVARDSQVAGEYAKIRWLYAQLGISDKTEIEFFQGGHCIHGQGTFQYFGETPALHRRRRGLKALGAQKRSSHSRTRPRAARPTRSKSLY